MAITVRNGRALGLVRNPKLNIARAAVPHLSAALPRLRAPATLASCDNYKGMARDPTMLGNAYLGDCVEAGTYRASEVWSYKASGNEMKPTNTEAIGLYSAVTGYIPGDPSTDQGTDPIAAFQYLMTKGLKLADGTTSIWKAVFEVDTRNYTDWQSCICEAGVVFLAINCYQSFMNVEQWGTWAPPGKNDANEGGHWVMSARYPNQSGFWIKSWGMDIFMPRETAAACVQNAYTAISPEWIETTGDTPFGMTEQQLIAAAAAVTQAPVAA